MRLKMVVGIASLMLGALGFKHIQNAPDLSTPKATVLSLLAAYANHDIAGLAKCVEGGVTSGLPQDLLTSEAPLTSPQDKDFVIEVNGDSAKVVVEYEATMRSAKGTSSSIEFVDLLNLKKLDSNWLIVPAKLDRATAGILRVNASVSLPLVTRKLSISVGDSGLTIYCFVCPPFLEYHTAEECASLGRSSLFGLAHSSAV